MLWAHGIDYTSGQEDLKAVMRDSNPYARYAHERFSR